MTTTWMPGAHVLDLTHKRGNGPFKTFLGVVLHVNESENGTSDSFFAADPPANPNSVTPNFQVYKDGTIHQYLPFDWQPWCQIDGNFNYAAIETAGLHSEPLTLAQLDAIARILAVYHTDMGMLLSTADKPGERGFGTHAMGGAAWGGHPCPGTIRTAQRSAILSIAQGSTDMALSPDDLAKIQAMIYASENRLTSVLTKTGVVVRQLMDITHKNYPSIESYFTGLPGYKTIAARLQK